ncbi:MAG: hypothetical protein MI743_21000 [Sneathiellales bacterium]|nr:hypothetical protein [Sneathiellales bacterium]
MPKKNTLNDNQLHDYYLSHFLRKASIIDSIAKLRKRNLKPIDSGEIAANDVKILDLKAKKALHKAKKFAFEANTHSIEAPTPEQLDRLKELVAKVEALNANNAILSEVIELTTETLTTFNNIHPDQSTA